MCTKKFNSVIFNRQSKIVKYSFFIIIILIFISLKMNATSILQDKSHLSNDRRLTKDPATPEFEVWINDIKIKVFTARVQDPPFDESKTGLDVGGDYSFASFDLQGPTKIKIRSLNQKLNNTIIRPNNLGIKYSLENDTIMIFTINRPQKLSIEPNGKNSPLLIFANPVMKNIPDTGDQNVIYFGPGVHNPKSDVIKVGDNQTLYLAEGAILKAGVLLSGDNAKICGRGILNGNKFIWHKHAPNMIEITGNNTAVRGIIIQGAASWTIPIRNCHNVDIENIKIVGGRAQNDDGIDIVNSQKIHIKNCFIRTDDDCFALKGMSTKHNRGNTENITVENSILWCNRARVFLLGHESRADYMRNITFKNIDIIHFKMVPFLLEPGEKMKLENVTFKDIRVHGEGQKELIRLRPTVNQYMFTKVPGYIQNILFKNITVFGLPGEYTIELKGADSKHSVRGVTMKKIVILKKRLNPQSKNFIIDNYVYQFKAK